MEKECIEICKWVHKKCTGIQRSLLQVKNFIFQAFQVVVQKGPEKKGNSHGDPLEIMEKICCFVDVLSTDRRAHDSIVFRIRAGWNKFKECLVFSVKRFISNIGEHSL